MGWAIDVLSRRSPGLDAAAPSGLGIRIHSAGQSYQREAKPAGSSARTHGGPSRG